MSAHSLSSQPALVSADKRADGTCVVKFCGHWHLSRNLPSPEGLVAKLAAPPLPRRVIYDSSELEAWDSGLVSLLVSVAEFCAAHRIENELSGMPPGLRRLLDLARAVPESEGARGTTARPWFFARVGNSTIEIIRGSGEAMEFLGNFSIAAKDFLLGRARFRGIDFLQDLQDCGPRAFVIVTLISFLVGIILAFMGAVQLEQFGASIYVADLVGIGMLREMGAIMTAIIMAGRTGAAFAAQLGTMKVTQETDALTTMGISPMQFLVLPRVLALVLMMPLLCLFSDLMGILGGGFVGISMLNLSVDSYYHETVAAISLTNLFLGLSKAAVYGAIIGICGCLRGFQCGNSSSAVGDAATSAVVTSIVLGVIACGIFAFVTNLLGI